MVYRKFLYSCESTSVIDFKPWQNDWTFPLNMHWTNVQCKMLRRFATMSNLVQSCSAMLRAAQSILKAVKNVLRTRLNFFCLKKMFSRFATPLNIVQFAQAHFKCKKGEFRHDGKEMESSASISSMNSRERYSGSNEDSSDKINCSSDDQSDRREGGYDDIDGTSSRPNRSSTFLFKSMIIDVTILAADFMFSSPWHPVISLPRAPKTKFQTPKIARTISQRKCSLDNV